MSDATLKDMEAERREACKANHSKILEVYNWYKGFIDITINNVRFY